MQNRLKSTKNIFMETISKLKDVYRKICVKSCVFFDYLGKKIAKTGLSANWITLLGLLVGLLAMNFVAMRMYASAILCILINRFFDGLDGAVARCAKPSDFGVFLDTICDYIFYAGIIFGFALANPEQNAVCAAFLLFAFTVAAVVMLAYAMIAYKKSKAVYISLNNSPFYLWGFAQGAETFIAVLLLCLLPSFFVVIAIFFGVLSLIKAVGLMVSAYYSFEISEKARGNEK